MQGRKTLSSDDAGLTDVKVTLRMFEIGGIGDHIFLIEVMP